jgi:hypothetical protein
VTLEANCDGEDLRKDFFLNNIIMNFLGRQVVEHPGHIDLSDYNKRFGNITRQHNAVAWLVNLLSINV